MLATIYQLLTSLDRKLTQSRQLPRPVISVGNLAMGGRSKTPFVVKIAELLKKNAYTPVVLTRGYKRKSKVDFVIKDDNVDVNDCGDEALEIYLRSSCPVLVSADRYSIAKKYLQQSKDSSKIVFILDDGFQHWALKRDLDIVLLYRADVKARLFPWGALREPVKSLRRADIILQRDVDFFKTSFFEKADVAERSKVLAVTTRVLSPDDRTEIKDQLKELELIELPDHAEGHIILAELARRQQPEILMGLKEAVKILTVPELRSFVKNKKINFTIEDKDYRFIFWDFSLELKQEKLFYEQILKVAASQ